VIVHITQDRFAGPKIGRDRHYAVRRLREECLTSLDVGRHVGAAEAIDRLLGVAHQEQRAGPDLERGPIVAVRSSPRVAAQAPKDFCLQGVRVLELVDQDMREARG
jgi:hypothetical protein